jgi:hypothetical protein
VCNLDHHRTETNPAYPNGNRDCHAGERDTPRFFSGAELRVPHKRHSWRRELVGSQRIVENETSRCACPTGSEYGGGAEKEKKMGVFLCCVLWGDRLENR